MLGRRRRSRVLRDNREVAGKMPELIGRMESFVSRGQARKAIADDIIATSDALDSLIKMGLVQETTDENGTQRYSVVGALPEDAA